MSKLLFAIGLTVGLPAALAAQDHDPVGRWDFETSIDGQTVSGWMEVTRAEGRLYARFQVEGQMEMPAMTLEMDGNRMTITAEIPDAGELLVELEFDGAEFTGHWSNGYDGADVWGRRAT